MYSTLVHVILDQIGTFQQLIRDGELTDSVDAYQFIMARPNMLDAYSNVIIGQPPKVENILKTKIYHQLLHSTLSLFINSRNFLQSIFLFSLVCLQSGLFQSKHHLNFILDFICRFARQSQDIIICSCS